MRVLFNQSSAAGCRTGVGHYAFQLLKNLRRLPQANVTAFPSERWLEWDQRFKNLHRSLQSLRSKLHPSTWRPPLAIFGLAAWAEHRIRRTYAGWSAARQRDLFFGKRFDLYHEPNFIPVDSSLATVTTLHDLSVLLHPEWHPAERVRWYEKEFAKAVNRSKHFIAVSRFTRRQVQHHLGVPAHQVTCVYNAARPEFVPLPVDSVHQVLRQHGLPSHYLLYLGTIEPRKNLLRLMQAYCGLAEALRREWPLLLVGQWGWNVERERAFYHDFARHRGIRHVGYLPDGLLPYLCNGARALVYPSLYEGFGLPPLEMLACGGAVLGSAIEPILEVLGGEGHTVAPEDTDGWRDALGRVLVEDDWWRQLRRGALNAARRFSWQDSAVQTLDVYDRVLGQQTAGKISLSQAA